MTTPTGVQRQQEVGAEASNLVDRSDDGSSRVFVARQPILDQRLQIAGYELLFRSSPTNSFDTADGDAASRYVIDHSLNTFGLSELTQGARAFVNFTRSLLVEQTAHVLPPDQVVIEILETVAADPLVLQACRRLKQKGYPIALDDVVTLAGVESLLAVADILKVDFRQANQFQRRALARDAAPLHLTLLAEKVETRDDYAEAIHLGYTLFQGYFFQKPEVVSRRDVPVSKLAALRLLKELYRPDSDWPTLEKTLKQDLGLPIKLLRYLNSAWFGLSNQVESLRHALILLGVEGIRQWASLCLVTDLGRGKSPEIIRSCLLRASMCERLATVASAGGSASNLFLIGLLSSLDALVGRPLDELLNDMAVPVDVSDALLRPTGRLGGIYRLVLEYERGNWPGVSERARALGIDEQELPTIYSQSLEWVSQVTSAADSR